MYGTRTIFKAPLKFTDVAVSWAKLAEVVLSHSSEAHQRLTEYISCAKYSRLDMAKQSFLDRYEIHNERRHARENRYIAQKNMGKLARPIKFPMYNMQLSQKQYDILV